MPRNKYDWLAFLFFLPCLFAIVAPGWYSIFVLLTAGRLMVKFSEKGDVEHGKRCNAGE